MFYETICCVAVPFEGERFKRLLTVKNTRDTSLKYDRNSLTLFFSAYPNQLYKNATKTYCFPKVFRRRLVRGACAASACRLVFRSSVSNRADVGTAENRKRKTVKKTAAGFVSNARGNTIFRVLPVCREPCRWRGLRCEGGGFGRVRPNRAWSRSLLFTADRPCFSHLYARTLQPHPDPFSRPFATVTHAQTHGPGLLITGFESAVSLIIELYVFRCHSLPPRPLPRPSFRRSTPRRHGRRKGSD